MKKGVLNHKYFLYITSFFAGMSIMAVELGASRLLAPYFSSSQIVWTIIIGTIMIALAIGNVIGGRMADKDSNPDRFYKRLLVSAVWIAAIPFLGRYVIALISGALAIFVKSNFLIWASLVSCIVIFVFPLILLGTATPSLVKYTVESLDNNGKIVGGLGALNTIGSIIGTFLPTFLTIPTVGTSVTFIIFSAVLLIIGLIYFISVKRKIINCIIAGALFIVFSFFGISNSFAFWETNLVYEGESIYNYLQVKENENSVILSTNVMFGVQSIMMKDGGLTGMYYDYALAAPYMAGVYEKAEGDILILGLGSGTYASQCTEYLENVNIEGVEIDKEIVDLSKRYFSLPESVSVSVNDARAYLAFSDKKYDVIMVDAYQDITIPFQMSTVEFFSLVREHLNEDGVMVVNMNMNSDAEGSINQALSDTISTVFSNVYTVQVNNGTNRELFASMNENYLQKLEVGFETEKNPDLKRILNKVKNNLEYYSPGSLILTDDKAPVEVLGMRVIDELISEELEYYRDIIREEGISGLQ